MYEDVTRIPRSNGVAEPNGKSGGRRGSLPIQWPIVAFALLCAFVPSYVDLARTIWTTADQAHGPIVLFVAIWLAAKRFRVLQRIERECRLAAGGLTLLVGLACLVVGRSQSFTTLEIAAQPLLISAVLLLTVGWKGLKVMALPIFFLLFLVPLPGVIVQALTTPLKSAVSAVSAGIMYAMGYPIARDGVILHVGPYQLLVADACAGLSSIFTLEALCLVYLSLMQHASRVRNLFMVLMAVPVAFTANVIRVCVLTLVTFHFGDEAGQGFAHDFAGMTLFVAALLLLLSLDGAYGMLSRPQRRDR